MPNENEICKRRRSFRLSGLGCKPAQEHEWTALECVPKVEPQGPHAYKLIIPFRQSPITVSVFPSTSNNPRLLRNADETTAPPLPHNHPNARLSTKERPLPQAPGEHPAPLNTSSPLQIPPTLNPSVTPANRDNVGKEIPLNPSLPKSATDIDEHTSRARESNPMDDSVFKAAPLQGGSRPIDAAIVYENSTRARLSTAKTPPPPQLLREVLSDQKPSSDSSRVAENEHSKRLLPNKRQKEPPNCSQAAKRPAIEQDPGEPSKALVASMFKVFNEEEEDKSEAAFLRLVRKKMQTIVNLPVPHKPVVSVPIRRSVPQNTRAATPSFQLRENKPNKTAVAEKSSPRSRNSNPGPVEVLKNTGEQKDASKPGEVKSRAVDIRKNLDRVKNDSKLDELKSRAIDIRKNSEDVRHNSKREEPKSRAIDTQSKREEPKSRAVDTRMNIDQISQPKGRGTAIRKTSSSEVAKDTSQVKLIWSKWNKILLKGNAKSDVSKLLSDAVTFDRLSGLLTETFPTTLVIEHFVLCPAGSYCFDRLIHIIKEEVEGNSDEVRETDRCRMTISVVNQLLSYMANLAASVLRVKDETRMKQQVADAIKDVMSRLQSAEKPLPLSLKTLFEIAKKEQNKSGRNRALWEEIRTKSHFAYRDLRVAIRQIQQQKANPISPGVSVNPRITNKVGAAAAPQNPAVSNAPTPRTAEAARKRSALADWTKKKRKGKEHIDFGKSDPKLDRKLRARGGKNDEFSVETQVSDGGTRWPSCLLKPNNATQEEAIVERLNELTLGGTVKFLGMLTEYIRGYEKVAEIQAESGIIPQLLPPTAVFLPDVAELKKRGAEIDKNRRIERPEFPRY